MKTNLSIHTIHREIDWLQRIIDQVIRSYLLQEGHENSWQDIAAPDLHAVEDPFANCIKDWNLNTYERLALVLALTPHIRPEVLDIFFGKNQIYDRGFTEFGGVTDKNHSGFLPTGRTLYFIMTAVAPHLTPVFTQVLNKQNILIKEQVLVLHQTESHIPDFDGILSLNSRWLLYFITGEKLGMEQGDSFPAKRITTAMDWEDIVLNDVIMEQLIEINTWLHHGHTLLKEWGLSKMIRPGYRSLFYGPPGTGKTLTATLLGKTSKRDVYKVDLSMIVSKYIGETEKNLGRIFDIAHHKDWILFFDEADALFGKRTAANSSNDRHANQQTAYLLQRIEDFPGTVILASNLKANMDEAFTRRFQSMVHFTMPTPEERYQLWLNAFSGTCSLDPEIDLWHIAETYEMAGGAIINVLRNCALQAVQRNDTLVRKQELLKALKREFKKENKTIGVGL